MSSLRKEFGKRTPTTPNSDALPPLCGYSPWPGRIALLWLVMLLGGLWGVGYERANLKDIGPGVVVGKTRPAFQKVQAVVDAETGARYLISCVHRLPEIGQRINVLANWRRTFFTTAECADENPFFMLVVAFWTTLSVFVVVLSFRHLTKLHKPS